MSRAFPTRVPRSLRCCGGFTLLEVALAILIVGTALVALTRMLTLGRLLADTDAKRVEAISILRHEAALIQSRGYATLSSTGSQAVDGHTGFTKQLTVVSAGGGLKIITVAVSWTSPTGQPVTEQVQFIVGDTELPVRTWEDT